MELYFFTLIFRIENELLVIMPTPTWSGSKGIRNCTIPIHHILGEVKEGDVVKEVNESILLSKDYTIKIHEWLVKVFGREFIKKGMEWLK